MAKGTYRAEKLNRAGERAELSARRTGESQPVVDYDMAQARAILRTRRGATVTGPSVVRRHPAQHSGH